MTKEETKELIERKRKLEIEIVQLEHEEVFDGMTITRLYGKLEHLRTLYNQHRHLNEKIEMVEHLAPRSEHDTK